MLKQIKAIERITSKQNTARFSYNESLSPLSSAKDKLQLKDPDQHIEHTDLHTQPSQPSHPTQPTQPTQPIQPTQHTQHSKSTQHETKKEAEINHFNSIHK
jgi:hypothetical protein